MSKNFTLFWDQFLDEKNSHSSKCLKNISEKFFEPKEHTINNILAYARSVRGVKVNSDNKILICLN